MRGKIVSKFVIFVFVLVTVVGLLRFRTILAIYYNNRGLFLLDQSDYTGAISYFSKTINIVPDLAHAHYNLGVSYAEIKEYDKAIPEFLKTIELNPEYIKARFSLAVIYYDQLRRYEDAARELKEILRINPGYIRAKEFMDRINLDFATASLNSGLDYFSQNKFEEAEQEFIKALEIKPGYIIAKYNLALVYLNRGQTQKAKTILEEIANVDSSNIFALRQLAAIYFNESDYAKSLNLYSKLTALSPNDVGVRNDLARIYAKLGNYYEAINELKYALTLEPGNFNVLYNLASAYKENGDYQEALTYYKRLQNLNPNYPFVHAELAGIYGYLKMEEERKNELYKAINEYKTQLIINPDDAVVLDNLAQAYLQIDQTELAKEAIERVFKTRDDYMPAYLTYGYILAILGDEEKAIFYLEKAKEIPELSEQTVDNIKKIIDKMNNKNETKIQMVNIYLKNGRVLTGEIVKETDVFLVLKVTIGESQGTLTIFNKEIERIDKVK